MKITIYLFICLFTYLSVSLNGQVINSQEKEKNEGIQRNATYNLEEIKVRWKKAALENCTGVPCGFICGSSTISDIDGNSYNTVLIGTQCWTKENLKVTKYNDGTNIPDVTNSASWGALTTGAGTVYEVSGTPESGYVGNYGYLYNWYAATDVKKICPTGWHIPTDGEWTSLIQFIDPAANASVTGTQSTTASSKLKSTSLLWNIGSPGTDNYGFSALPGGYRSDSGSFFEIRNYAYFWTASQFSSNIAWYRHLNIYGSNVSRLYAGKSVGASVRCLKD